jgi:hypothetical protein
MCTIDLGGGRVGKGGRGSASFPFAACGPAGLEKRLWAESRGLPEGSLRCRLFPPRLVAVFFFESSGASVVDI